MESIQETLELIETPDPLTESIRKAEKKLAKKEKEASDLQMRLYDLQKSLKGFLGEYYSRVGIYYVELEKIELRIKEYQYRLKRLREAPAGTLHASFLQQIEEEIKINFAADRKRIQDLEKETGQKVKDHKEELRKNEWRDRASPEFVQQVKILFRKLALRFHPDKARDPDEEKEFQETMAAIIEAYSKGDMAVLILYMEKAERNEKIKNETGEERLARLQVECKKVCRMIRRMKKELKTIMASQTCQLKAKVEEAALAGKDLLMELTEKALATIGEKKSDLAVLVAEYQRITEGAIP